MRTMVAVMILLTADPARPQADGSGVDSFRFKHEPGRPLTYGMILKTTMEMNIGGHEAMKMAVEMRFKLKLTPDSEARDFFSALKVEPSDLEGDWDIIDAGGRTLLRLQKGLKLTGTRDGAVVIDTEKRVGLEAAETFKKEISGLTLSGFVDLDGRGVIREYRGEEPFVTFWKESGQEQFGLFGITFPNRPLPAGAAWEETWFLKKMGQVILEGEGLRCVNKYERLPDREVSGKTLAEFTLSAPFDGKDLTGSMDQGAQKMRVDVRKFRRRGTGRFLFDPVRGSLIQGSVSADGDAAMRCTLEGRTTDMRLRVKADMETALE
jgi:hypothetical protein